MVVYKVDRLTRALADFAKLVELFDAHGVSFVSVTQAFNTTSSMGRLTLNVLLSFAQFEREVTGERIRDKIAASKKKGLWMGGHVPLGYRVQDRKLVVDEAEATTVRLIFERYREIGSLTLLLRDLRQRGVVTKQRPLSKGTVRGGIPFTTGPLAYLLKNRTYLGEIVHRGERFEGEHDADHRARAVRCGARETRVPTAPIGSTAGTLVSTPHRQALRRPRQPYDSDPREQGRKTLSLLCLLRPASGPGRRGGLRQAHPGPRGGGSHPSSASRALP